MDLIGGDISIKVFRRVNRSDLGSFSFDSQMLSVLMELDGKQDTLAVAAKSGLDLNQMREVLARLLKLKLIEPVEEAVAVLDADFLKFLASELSVAIGPIAHVIIEEAVAELDSDVARFPSRRAAELVDLLSREIQREEKRTIFKRNMLQKIRAKNY